MHMQRVSMDIKLLKAGGLFSTESISSFHFSLRLCDISRDFTELRSDFELETHERLHS